MADLPIPPDFCDVAHAVAGPLDDLALAAAVRVDARDCGERYALVPSVARYVAVVDPRTHPESAREVAHQVLNAARGDRGHAVRVLSARFPAWAALLEDASVAMDLLGTDVDAAPLPVAIGPPAADGHPRFLVGDVLARGSFGVVAEGFDRVMAVRGAPQADVVIKVVRAESGGAPWAEEARRAAAIDHPCGIEVRAEGVLDTGRGFVAFERIRGRSLLAMAAAGERMPPGRAILAMGQLCDAIAELHAAGLVHGDISPANVMVDAFGRLRLVDFGLARPIDPESAAADVVRTAELLQWLVLGYVPLDPRCAPGLPVGARARAVRIGRACRLRPPTAEGLAARLLRAEWSYERRRAWAIGIVFALGWFAFKQLLTGLRA